MLEHVPPIYTLCPVILYIAGLCVHRIYFHRLHQHPGPLLAKLTNWYAAYYTWQGTIHLKLREWHDAYGPIVRFGPNSISMNSPTAMAQIYSARANVRKDDAYSVMSASSHIPSTISCLDKGQHAAKRRILAQLFTPSALKGVEERVLSHIRTFCASLGESSQDGRATDMAVLSDYLTFDIISDLCYGQAFGLLQCTALRYIPNVISRISRRNAICFIQPAIQKYRLDRLFLAPISTQIRAFGRWIQQQQKEHPHKITPDFRSHLTTSTITHSGPDPRPLTNKEVWIELLQLVIAGSDTTAVALSAAVFHLCHHAAALARATAEVRTHFPTTVEAIRPGSPQLRRCTYLHACIHESLRLAPPVTGLAPRRVLEGGIQVDGVWLPAGIVLGCPIYAVQRDRTCFPAPDRYFPGRWEGVLDSSCKGEESDDMGEEERQQQRQKRSRMLSAFCPFSVGPRACVARRFAMDEITVTLARALFLYDLRLAGRENADTGTGAAGAAEYALKGWMTSGREGPVVYASPREGCSL
ncbi:cytochrome P450 [Aspergillus aculeatinus CBS 121060]|uniref:Cytochrome P450 monooxygenase n=1 Tax=Aspergillus aculeatinus CBS 121060 TaxID=1448322 RepID=A0ACD1H8H3_9EURO|nr:cytochrome P450 monooxygenase [Aspergillus aculeatinus CBS 121060]RAH69949.1 cytochrome P450 monooxygenase [Aspergillus aculeatinus CBS 121060]